MTLEQLAAFVQSAGVIGIGVLILVGGARQTWVWGWTHQELRQDRDFWRDTALRGLSTADKATTIAERKTRPGA